MMSMQKTLLYGLLWTLLLVAYPGQAEEEGALVRLQHDVHLQNPFPDKPSVV
jgi:hypothetical protein